MYLLIVAFDVTREGDFVAPQLVKAGTQQRSLQKRFDGSAPASFPRQRSIISSSGLPRFFSVHSGSSLALFETLWFATFDKLRGGALLER